MFSSCSITLFGLPLASSAAKQPEHLLPRRKSLQLRLKTFGPKCWRKLLPLITSTLCLVCGSDTLVVVSSLTLACVFANRWGCLMIFKIVYISFYTSPLFACDKTRREQIEIQTRIFSAVMRNT